MSLTATPEAVPADGTTPIHVGVRLGSAQVPLALPLDAVIALRSSEPNALITAFSTTDVNGMRWAQIRSHVPGTETLTVVATQGASTVTLPQSIVVTFTFSPPASSSAYSNLVANPNKLTADGVTTATLTFTVRDTTNLPLVGAPVAWTVTGSNNTLLPNAAATDANGVATATLASTTAEIKTVTATSGGAQLSQPVTFEAGSPNNLFSTLTASPNVIPANSNTTATLTVTLVDVFGNPVSNAAVTFNPSGVNNGFSPSATGNTDTMGVLTATMVSSTAQTEQITVSGTGYNLNTNVTFYAVPSVAPLYSQAANWLDYASNTGGRYGSNNTPCAGTETGTYANACLHGGELRVLAIPQLTSCAGLTATDALAAFDWICDNSMGSVRILSTGLASGKNLSDIVNPNGVAWRANSVTLASSGTPLFTTTPAVWWGNTVTQVPSAGGNITTPGIWVVNSAVSSTLNITANNVGVVTNPLVTLLPTTLGNAVVQFVGVDYGWFEGSIGAANSNGLLLQNTNFTVIRNVQSSGLKYLGLALVASYKNFVHNVTLKNTTEDSVLIANTSSYNDIDAVSIDHSGNEGIHITSGASQNVVTDSIITRSADCGIYIDSNSTANILAQTRVFAATAGAVAIYNSASNVMSQMLVTSNAETGVYVNTAPNTVVVATTTVQAGTQEGLAFSPNSYNAVVLNSVTANNQSSGLNLSSSPNATVVNVASVSNQGYGVNIFASPANQFHGLLILGSDALAECQAPTAAGSGLITTSGPGTCLVDTSLSDATALHNQSLAGTFVGPLTVADPSNASNTAGGSTFGAITDWLHFASPYRGWGIDATQPMATSAEGACSATNANCRIYDWSLSPNDTVARNVLTPNSSPTTATHVWSGGGTSTFLTNVIELLNDGIGNDNGLCESNEACLMTPNLGAYQGTGALIPAGTVTLYNVTLWQYPAN